MSGFSKSNPCERRGVYSMRGLAAAEARPSGVAANDPEVYVEVSAGDGYTSGRPAVGDFS